MKRSCVILACFLLLTACGTAPTATVSTTGSSSLDRVIGALNEQFMLDNIDCRVTYDPSGSGAGIEAARTGACDVGLSSRSLRDSETASGLTGTVLALDAIAVAVHPDNPVEGLTLHQLAAIYTGATVNWQEVGGLDAPIAVVGREAGSGTREGFEEAVGVVETAVYGQELTSTGAVLEAVRSNPNAIGYASLASVGNAVKILIIDGVPCTGDTVLSGAYTIQRPFVLVTRTDVPLSRTAQRWFDFVTGPSAKSIITAAGVIPAAE